MTREQMEYSKESEEMAETLYKDYFPISGVVEPNFLEYLKGTFRRSQQYHNEGVVLGSREIARLSNKVEGAKLNSRYGFEKMEQRFTDEDGQEYFSLLIYMNKEDMETAGKPLYRFTTKIHG